MKTIALRVATTLRITARRGTARIVHVVLALVVLDHHTNSKAVRSDNRDETNRTFDSARDSTPYSCHAEATEF